MTTATCFSFSAAVEQRANDRRVLSRRAVERRFDGENLRILGRLRYELNDRIERLVRMVQQDVAFANLREDVGDADQPLGNRRLKRLVAQIVVAGKIDDLPQVAERDQSVDLVAVDGAELERRAEQVAHVLRHAALDLQAHRLAEAAAPQLRLDRPQQIVGLVFLRDRGRRRASPGRDTSRARACRGRARRDGAR